MTKTDIEWLEYANEFHYGNHPEINTAVKHAIEALKKQKPVKPIETWYDSFVCPICNGFTTCQKWKNGNPYNAEFEYCPTCGQKLEQEVE